MRAQPVSSAPQNGSFLAWRRHHAMPPGLACANCATTLLGPWCHACGQSAHDFHRNARHLVAETFESLFHADGRLWRTLGRLILQPARLTRDYLDGHRAPQIPPLRLFLVVLLTLFLTGSWTGRRATPADILVVTPQDRADMMTTDIHFGLGPQWDRRATDWARLHIGRAIDRPDELAAAMAERGENFGFLMLPLSAFILWALFAARRSLVLFDHFVFSMHSLSFLGLLVSASFIARSVVDGASGLLLLAAPVHLFSHMRGTYGGSASGTLLRMALLLVASSVGFAIILAGLLIVGLETLRG